VKTMKVCTQNQDHGFPLGSGNFSGTSGNSQCYIRDLEEIYASIALWAFPAVISVGGVGYLLVHVQ
jgi:hypothetical protein